jgi:WD40 repeat protein
MEGHTKSVDSVAISPDGRFALSGSEDKTLRLWELSTGRCIRIMEGHTNDVNSVAISPDGRFALSGSGDNTIRLWEFIWELEFPDECIRKSSWFSRLFRKDLRDEKEG